MAQPTAVVELAALRAELERPVPAPGGPAPTAAEPPRAEQSELRVQIEQLVQELQSGLDEVTEGTEDLIAEHPLPSVAAAFLLGVAVGWVVARG
jgi:hypothetical protein